MKYDYDLFVIGAGSGGVRAARMSAACGARVAIAEDKPLGGTCVNAGCIPKKLFVYAAHFAEDFDDAAGYGWTGPISPRFDWHTLLVNKDREIARLNEVYASMLDKAGAERLAARATLIDAHTVEVAERRLTAEYVLIATGGWPIPLPVPGGELAVSSNEMFHLAEVPRSILIVGGGYIAVEFAGILHGLGCEVTLIHRGDRLLRGFDEDVRVVVGEEMRKKGIDIHFERQLSRLDARGEVLRATLTDGSTIDATMVLGAIGRAPNTRDVGLEAAGVKVDGCGAIVVDEYARTSVANVYAVGDVTNRLNLTPVAIAEGQAVADTLFGGRPTKVDFTGVPSAVFSQPPVATVGLTEAEARQQYGAVDVYRSRFRALKHTLSGRDERTFMKLVVDAPTDRVLGCHMVGADGPEIIQGLAVALKAGATKAHFDGTIGLHPTAAEEFVTMRTKS